MRISGIYVSEALGYISGKTFYNQCLHVETDLGVEECLEILLAIEQQLGRSRKTGGYSDRFIDIDILFFDELVLESASLIIPHDKMCDRRFVLQPLNEILPDFVHPVRGEKVLELLDRCRDVSEVIPLHRES